MKKIAIQTSALAFDDVNALPKADYDLMQEAIAAQKMAYAPYSKFTVGAAILLANNEVVRGNNQESAAYPSGMCAERVAVWKAASSYPGVAITTMAIVASSENYTVNRPVGPCGACRQTLLEYEVNQKSPMAILFMGEVGQVIKTTSLVSLLPFSFDDSFL